MPYLCDSNVVQNISWPASNAFVNQRNESNMTLCQHYSLRANLKTSKYQKMQHTPCLYSTLTYSDLRILQFLNLSTTVNSYKELCLLTFIMGIKYVHWESGSLSWTFRSYARRKSEIIRKWVRFGGSFGGRISNSCSDRNELVYVINDLWLVIEIAQDHRKQVEFREGLAIGTITNLDTYLRWFFYRQMTLHRDGRALYYRPQNEK